MPPKKTQTPTVRGHVNNIILNDCPFEGGFVTFPVKFGGSATQITATISVPGIAKRADSLGQHKKARESTAHRGAGLAR